MGRLKTAFAEAGATSPRAQKPGRCSCVCGLCSAEVDPTEEHLAVQCNVCGVTKLHRECAVSFLQARAKAMTNSRATAKMVVYARKHPQDLFRKGEACPNQLCTSEVEPKPGSSYIDKLPGSRGYQGRLAGAACPGFTQSAEIIKPAKEVSTPEPEAQPVRNKPQPTAGTAPHKPPQAKKAAASLHSSSTRAGTEPANAPILRGANIVPTPGSGAAARLGAAQGPLKRKAGSGSRRRPAQLVLCPSLVDCGKCHILGCEHAHSEEEQRERQAVWAARRQAGREAEVQGWQFAEGLHERVGQASEEGDRGLGMGFNSLEAQHNHSWPHHHPPHTPPSAASVASSLSSPSASARLSTQHSTPPLALSAYALHLLRSFKRSCCVNTLLDMGFACDQAQAAAAATGCEVEAAAQLLLEGQPCVGEKEPNLTRELRELTAAAAACCASPVDVEAQLAATGGNVEAVCEALRQGGGCSLPEELPASSVAISEPATPSLRLDPSPTWALDASSTHSLSPRAASAQPAAAVTVAAAVNEVPGVLSLADFSSSPGHDGMFGLAAAAPVPGAGPAGGQLCQQGQAESAAGAPLAWTPPEMDRQQPGEEEVDELMQMLGIA